MFNSFEQIKWGGGSEGRGGGVLEFLLSVPTALLFDSCPILYSASSPHAHPRWKKKRVQLAQFTLYTPSRMWAHEQREHISTPTLLRTWPENYCVFFFYISFFVCCFCISFGRHSIDIYPGRFSDTMRVHLFAQFVCSPSILCLCAHKHKSASAPLLSLEKVPFHLFPPTCLKRRGGEGLGYRNPPDRFKIHTKHCNDGVNRV